MILEHLVTFEKLRLVKEIIIQLSVYWIIFKMTAIDLSKQQALEQKQYIKLILLEI